ncbi:MAG: ferritin-like domain-containing protein [Planctomycetota bacterium]
MSTVPNVGNNRTGASLAPDRTREMEQGFDEFGPTSHMGDGATGLQEEVGETLSMGSLPPMRDAKRNGGATPSKADVILLDKLGERLAFERTGTRLYEALLRKLESRGSFDGGPTREDLEEIRAEERSHFELVRRTLEKMGADPTAVTPAANVVGVTAMGIQKIVADPRSNMVQCLDAMLMAELTDNAAWETLIELARKANHEEFVPAFEKAHTREEEHLAKIERWLHAGHGLL